MLQLGYHYNHFALSSILKTVPETVDVDVFTSVVRFEKENATVESHVRHLFGLIDRDGSGRIEVEELQQFWREMGLEANADLLDDLVDEVERPLFGGQGFAFSDFLYFIRRNEVSL